MAFQQKRLSNPKTGQQITFLQTAKDSSGKVLEMESVYHSRSPEPIAHYHPFQTEDFTVISGQLTTRINGQLKVHQPGDVFCVPANTVHSMWNNSDAKTIVNWKVYPALNTEHFFETFYGLAQEGKINDKGMPGILQIALTSQRYSHVFRVTKPPYVVQKILFAILTPFAYLLGLRPTYKKYLD